MVKLLSITVLMLVATLGYGQETKSKSRIKFIDGSELNVVILENYPGKYVKIQLPDNEKVTLKYSSILSIKHKDYSYYSKFMHSKGFYIEGSTSLLFGKATEFEHPRLGVALGVTANYQFNSHLSAGIGIEPTAVFIDTENILMPIYGRMKFIMIERRVSPLILLDAGWSFHLSGTKDEFSTTTYAGGWYAKPSIGLQINSFTLSLGYQIQKVTTTKENDIWWRTNSITVEERIMKNVSIAGSYRF